MRNAAIWLLLFLTSIFLLLPNGTLAFYHTTSQGRASSFVSARDSPSNHMTILIIDMSAAMIDDDPYQVRCDAARAFIDLSAPGNWVGLISMSGSKARIWQEPTLTDAIDERTKLKAAIDHPPAQIPDCHRPGGGAPVADALKLALSMLNEATQEENDFQGSVILMSNGVPSSDSTMIENTLLPQFQQNHWPIDTIPLGSENQGASPHLSLQTIARHTGGIPYPDAQNPVTGEVSSLSILPFFTDILKRQVGSSLLSTLASATPVSIDQPREYNFRVTPDDKGLYLLLIREPQDVDSVTQQSAVQAQVTSAGPKPFMLSTLDTALPLSGTDIEQNASYAVFSIGGMDSAASYLPAGWWELNVSGSGQFAAVLLKTSWLQIALSSPQSSAAPLNIASPLKLVATIIDGRNPNVPFQDRSVSLTALLVPHEGQKQTTPPYRLDSGPSPGEYQKTIQLPTDMPEGTYTLTVTASKNTGSLVSGVTETVLLFHFPIPLFMSYQATEYQWPGWASTIYHWPLLNQLGTRMSIGNPTQLTVGIKLGRDTYTSFVIATLSNQKGQTQRLGIVDKGQGLFLLSLPAEAPGRYTLNLVLNGSIDGFPFSSDAMSNLSVQVIGAQLTSSMYWSMMLTTGALVLFLLLLLGVPSALGYHWTTGVKSFGGCKCEETRQYYSFSPQGKRSWFRPGRHRPKSDQFELPEGLRFRFYRKIPFVRPNGCIKVKLNNEDKRIRWTAQNHGKGQPLSRSHYRKVSRLTCQVFAHPDRMLPIRESRNYTFLLPKRKKARP